MILIYNIGSENTSFFTVIVLQIAKI